MNLHNRCDRPLFSLEAWTDPILMAWSDMLRRYHVDDRPAQDTVQKTYATLPELLEYGYRVASCAGLLTIPIIGWARGATMQEAAPFTIKLGQALQLTDILARRADAPARAVIERLSGYARDLYRQAWPGFSMLSGTGRAAVGMGTLIFRSYLDELERRGFDSLPRPVKPPGTRRLWALATGWTSLLNPT